MFTRLREQLGTAGFAVAIVALVAALAGTAYAATKLNSTQKKEVEKIAKKFAGKPGAPGSQGNPGVPGTNGKDGTNGTNGVSPTGTAFSGNLHGCTEGGVEFKGANTTFACNGVKGTNGTTGFTDTLPSGKTETGNWALSSPEAEGSVLSALSFSIPLTVPLIEANIHVLEPATTTTECPGSVENPEAIGVGLEEPTLCIYEETLFGVEAVTPLSFSPAGVVLLAPREPELTAVLGYGSYAVAEG